MKEDGTWKKIESGAEMGILTFDGRKCALLGVKMEKVRI